MAWSNLGLPSIHGLILPTRVVFVAAFNGRLMQMMEKYVWRHLLLLGAYPGQSVSSFIVVSGIMPDL